MTEILLESATPVGEEFKTKLGQFVDLELLRREQEDALKQTNEKINELEKPLLASFADHGIQNARVGSLTVYVKIDRLVSKKSGVETEAICVALRRNGFGYLVSEGYNAITLRSQINELIASGAPVPEELANLLNIFSEPRLRTRKT